MDVKDMYNLPPPELFMEEEGASKVGWSEWKEYFENYISLVEEVRRPLSPEEKAEILLFSLGAGGREMYHKIGKGIYKGTDRNILENIMHVLDERFKQVASGEVQRYEKYIGVKARKEKRNPKCAIIVGGIKIKIIADSGSHYTVISASMWSKKFAKIHGFDLKVANVSLKSFTGEDIILIGYKVMDLCYKERSTRSAIYISDNQLSMLGWNDQRKLRISLDQKWNEHQNDLALCKSIQLTKCEKENERTPPSMSLVELSSSKWYERIDSEGNFGKNGNCEKSGKQNVKQSKNGQSERKYESNPFNFRAVRQSAAFAGLKSNTGDVYGGCMTKDKEDGLSFEYLKTRHKANYSKWLNRGMPKDKSREAQDLSQCPPNKVASGRRDVLDEYLKKHESSSPVDPTEFFQGSHLRELEDGLFTVEASTNVAERPEVKSDSGCDNVQNQGNEARSWSNPNTEDDIEKVTGRIKGHRRNVVETEVAHISMLFLPRDDPQGAQGVLDVVTGEDVSRKSKVSATSTNECRSSKWEVGPVTALTLAERMNLLFYNVTRDSSADNN